MNRHNGLLMILLLGLLLPVEVLCGTATQTGNPVKELQKRMAELKRQVVRQLELTEQQRRDLQTIQEKREQAQHTLLQQLNAVRRAMKMEMMARDIATRRMFNLHTESKRLITTLMDLHFDSLVAVRKTLRPKQVATLQQEFDKVAAHLSTAPEFPLPTTPQAQNKDE